MSNWAVQECPISGTFSPWLELPFIMFSNTSSNLVFIPKGLSRVMKKVISMAHHLDFVCYLIKIKDFGNSVLEIGCVCSEVKKGKPVHLGTLDNLRCSAC
jgi:hypothetical protein